MTLAIAGTKNWTSVGQWIQGSHCHMKPCHAQVKQKTLKTRVSDSSSIRMLLSRRQKKNEAAASPEGSSEFSKRFRCKGLPGAFGRQLNPAQSLQMHTWFMILNLFARASWTQPNHKGQLHGYYRCLAVLGEVCSCFCCCLKKFKKDLG